MGATDKSRWLIIPIELLARELPSRLLLACAAASRGYQVVVGNQSRIIQHISRLPRGIIFEKSICDHREPRLKSFSEMGLKICNSDEESDGMYMEPESFMNSRMTDQTLSVTSKFCCWSDLQREMLVERFSDFDDRFVTTGTCRTDIWRKEFHPLYADAAEDKRKRYGRYILFNSNFSHCIHHSGPDYMFESAESLGLIKSQEDYDFFVRQIEEGNANLKEYAEIFPKILEWMPDHHFVIRPHPVDDVDYWVQLTKGFPRTTVLREGPATPWILGADVVLHHGCMTAIETALLGRPAVFYGPKPDMSHDRALGTKLSVITKTPEELRAALTDAVQGGQASMSALEKTRQYFSSLEGPFAFERILDALDEVALEPQPPSQGLLSGNIISPTLGWKVKRALKFKPAETRSEADKVKWPGISVDELSALADKLTACTPRLSPVSVTPVHREVFWIQPR